MGKYSSVNVSLLLSNTQTALSELNQKNLNNINNIIKNKTTWNTPVTTNVTNTLNNIATSNTIEGSMSKLKSNLQKLEAAANLIKTYQELEKEIQELETKKFKKETRTDSYTDENGQEHSYSYEETVIDQAIVNQINAKTKQKEQLEKNITNKLQS